MVSGDREAALPSVSFSWLGLLSAAAMLLAGAGLHATLLGVRAGVEHFPIVATGMVMSAYYAGYIVGSRACESLIHRVGYVRTFAALAAIASAIPLLQGLFVDPIAWILLRAASGFCFFGLFMVMESWINGRATNADRGTWLAIYMKTSLGAQAVSQLFLNLAPPTEMALFVLCAVLISNALVPIALTRGKPPKMPSGVGTINPKELFRIAPSGIVGCFCSGLLTSAFSGLAPLMGTEIGFSTAKVSLFMSAVILGGAVLQWPIGRLSDAIDRRLGIAIAGLLAAGISVILALTVGRASTFLFPLGFLFGGAIFPLYSLSVAHANDFMRDDDLIAASRGLLLAFGLGALIGPYAGSWAIEITGPAGLFGYTAVVAGCLGAFAAIRAISGAPASIADQEAFVLVPETTPVAEALDPRTQREVN